MILDFIALLVALSPIFVWITACYGLLLRLTRGDDRIGGKAAARIAGALGLALVMFAAVGGLVAYGLLGYVVMLWVTMLIAPFVALTYVAPGAFAWLMRQVPIGREEKI